ncbi:MAG: tetratricopeptide repeat-containing glycosyltransferase, partial [Anaerotignaceae bacterium]
MNKKHTLAIGMIVKNEEKYLYRCLEALTPLREAVNCQLIIVDTGSTDKTVEIAKEFTDEVYDFDWIDDFSAARNETIKYADAQWYMFIDADEIFVDIQPIIDFFTSGEYKKYNSACHNRLEILSKDEKNVKNSVISRLFLMDSNCVFRGIIHETIPYIIPFNKVIEATSKHYGYNYEAVEDKKAKFDRNVSLLKKSFEKNPNDLRELYHLIRELLFSKKLYEVEKYIDHSKSLLEKNKEDSYRYGIVYCESLYYFYLEAFDKSIEVAKKRLELSKNTIPADADVYFLMAKNYINLDNPQKVVECLEKSLKIYRDTENGLISKETMSTAEILLIEKNFQEMAEKDLILHYGKIENFQKAKELLEKNKENSSFDYYALKYIEKSKDYDYLFEVFLRTKAEEDEKKYNLLILSIENFIKTEVI